MLVQTCTNAVLHSSIVSGIECLNDAHNIVQRNAYPDSNDQYADLSLSARM